MNRFMSRSNIRFRWEICRRRRSFHRPGKLAAYLDVSRNTVDFAYGQLAAEGYIESRPRSGFYVCQVEELAALDIHVETEEVRGGEKKAQMPYDFSPSGTDMEYFPYHVWRKL